MEPNHPIAYFTILEILTRVLAMPDISNIKPVFLTGPDALKFAYAKFLDWGKDIFDDESTHRGKFNKTSRKIALPDSPNHVAGKLGHTFDDIVAWNSTFNMTRKERTERLNGVVHWLTALQRTQRQRKQKYQEPCWDYLYEMDNNITIG
jgi:hypothetical protein